ncbi:urea ABC transporter permease subunit UrtB [Phenylobacterium sp.]|uniref:urea ABC transporter permease subunit UrtB n=1 Tax=Phenylobacterium sp. TaxID=1871053 RepID=UPI002732F29A|nr:urea ABC transporter permease subunit UrtB [Phenylobacterium sp.]MDP3175239.1 urea ABC transporter permease subunit UrtB [Phenylobacterium sp.]MDP3658635.1 urea ABC transporter permease subunit UrtB [Phenylobacterium sp.]
MDIGFLIGQIFNGLSVGSIYILAALGLALSFGLMRVINMAHGEIVMFGGYVAYLTIKVVPGPLGIPAAMLAALVVGGVLGAVLETTIVRRLAERPLETLLATWGVSLIAQQAARDLFGATGVSVTAPPWMAGAIDIGGQSMPVTRLFIMLVAGLALGALALLLTKTRIGLLVRAANQDRATAAAIGVNVRHVDMFVFALGSGVAGLAGVILALLGPVTPTVGQSYIVTAFLVVILGGLGSIAGTAIAAILIGLVSALAQIFVDVSFSTVITLLFVILFLQFRPQGVVAVRSRALDD